jgi:hypothetical protein
MVPVRIVSGFMAEEFLRAVAAGTNLAQEIKGIDSGTVSIAPFDLNCIRTYRVDLKRPEVLRKLRFLYDTSPRPFFNTRGTVAFCTQINGRINSFMAVGPQNADPAVLSFFDLYGLRWRLISCHGS